MKEKMVAIKYEKVKIWDKIYLYVFNEFLNNVDFNGEVVTYNENGEEKRLYDISDPDFVISDEKYGFADLMDESELLDLYEEKEYVNALKQYINDSKKFFRLGIVDEKRKCIKIFHSMNDRLFNLEGDTELLFDQISNINSYNESFMLTFDSLDILVEDMKKKKYDKALNTLQFMKKLVNDFNEIYGDKLDGDIAIDLFDTPDIEELEEELDNLVGLEEIKKEIEKLKVYLTYLEKVKDRANLEDLHLNMIFTGNPGTGKTTVARIVAGMLSSLGYIQNPNILEVTANDFIAGYVGQTAEKTQEIIEQGRDGVIFIDEAYAFASPGNEFANEALSEIVKEMDESNTVFIFAGYKKEMEDFIKANSGLKSKITRSFEFKDYTNEELFEMFERKLKASKLKMSKTAKAKIKKIIAENMYEDNFGNARYINQLFEKLIINHSYNTKDSESINSLLRIHMEDVEGLSNPLEDKENELNELVGLSDIKKMIEELKANLKYIKATGDERDLRLNMIFTGNPGTGKTTVARIISHILYKYGYVKKPKFKETTSRDFIAGYVGQTAIKTQEIIKEARGGVIFIDEAYTFANPSQQYANEALGEILKEMEDKETVFIFAGYKDEMKDFINMNSGIESRIGNAIEFKNYSTQELYQMFELKLSKSKLVIDEEAKAKIIEIIDNNKNSEHFGNGRFIDQLFDILIRKHAYNYFSTKENDDLKTIKLVDTLEINDLIKGDKVKKLGF